jgi:hypothetical protein
MLVHQRFEEPGGQVPQPVIPQFAIRRQVGSLELAPDIDSARVGGDSEVEASSATAMEDMEAELVDSETQILDLLDVEPGSRCHR